VRLLAQKGPREVARVVFCEHVLSWDVFPESLIHASLRALGVDVATPSGLKGARIQTRDFSIGKRTWVNRGLYAEGEGRITIGEGTLIGPEVMIITSTHARDERGLVDPHATCAPVRIGDRCWIGARVTIVPGVSIGDDVTVAAGAVVASDIGPGGLYGGVPARRLR
jgi:acetyltransferase-like isoleucine patch superfamily enzyme